jgi:hypothetical protein
MATLAEAVGVSYGSVPNALATWDALVVQGCACDVGWSGHDCARPA